MGDICLTYPVCCLALCDSGFTSSTQTFSGVWRTFTLGQHVTATVEDMETVWISAVSVIQDLQDQTAMPALL